MFGRIFFHHRIGHGEGGFESNEPDNTSTLINGIYILVIIINKIKRLVSLCVQDWPHFREFKNCEKISLQMGIFRLIARIVNVITVITFIWSKVHI